MAGVPEMSHPNRRRDQIKREWRMQSYIFWALLGMVGYSFTTLFVKLAVGAPPSPIIWNAAVAASVMRYSPITSKRR
jgi:hypothetical protein